MATDQAVVGRGLPETIKAALIAALPVEWLDDMSVRGTWETSLPPGTLLDSAPLLLLDINPWAAVFVKIRVNGRDGIVSPDRLEEALPEWHSCLGGRGGRADGTPAGV